jgi:hypothetical protein
MREFIIFFLGAINRLRSPQVLSVLLVPAMLLLSSCGENRSFEEEFIESAVKIQDVLIKEHIIKNPACFPGPLCLGEKILWNPERGGMSVNSYGIVDSKVLAEISYILVRMFSETPTMQRLNYTAYQNPKRTKQNRSLFIVKLRR